MASLIARRRARARRAGLVVVVAAVLAVGCSSTGDGLPPVSGPFAPGRSPLPGFGELALRVGASGEAGGGRQLCVLLAESQAQRERGLMGVTDRDLGGYDGMLFRYSADTTAAFWMRNTPMPLTLAYLAADGGLVSRTDMAPCRDSPSCPSYPPRGPYRMALEVPQGRLATLGIGRLTTVVPAGACRPASG